MQVVVAVAETLVLELVKPVAAMVFQATATEMLRQLIPDQAAVVMLP
jgi:hypothetical protein